VSGDGPGREPDPRSVPDRGGIDANESDRREAREGCDALVVVDVQQGFDDPAWGERNNPDAEERIARLLDFWRASDRPIVHLRHDSTEFDSPLRPDRPGNASKPEIEPKEGEAVLGKEVNSGFVGTDLEARLHGVGAERLTLVGLTFLSGSPAVHGGVRETAQKKPINRPRRIDSMAGYSTGPKHLCLYIYTGDEWRIWWIGPTSAPFGISHRSPIRSTSPGSPPQSSGM
jgi:hypothetical protein